jgi:hypothetical protein
MTTFNTGNPVPSVDVRDLYDNAQNFDIAVNDRASEIWRDRLGVQRLSWFGAEQHFNRFMDASSDAFQQFLSSSGYKDIGDYGPGLEITARNQVFWRDGELYRADASLTLPYTTTGVWADEASSFVSVGDAALRQELGNVSGDLGGPALIGYKAAAPGSAVLELQRWLDRALNVESFVTTAIDGVTTNQAGIQAAINAAMASGQALYWPRKTFVSTGNLANFHNVLHVGEGIIVRGSDTWYITPRGDERNITHVAAGAVNENDGLSLSFPATMGQAFLRMRGIGSKALDGRWRIHLSGNLTANGVRFYDLPPFRNRLEIFGDDVALTATPTTVWDGTAATEMYALRGDWSNGLFGVFLHFRNIKFTNWNKSTNAGAIVVWAPGQVLSENIHTDGCSVGAWYRQCYVRHIYGTVANAGTYGVTVQYCATGNIGNLQGGGITFINCAEGVNVSRQTTGYVQGNTFTGCSSNITCSRNSRIRPQGNIHNNWTLAAYYLQALAVLTPDNGDGSPDIFNMTPTDASPVLRIESGSKHSQIHRNDDNINSYNSGGSVITITGAGSEVLLSQAPGVVPGDFVPARIPAYWFYSSSAMLDISLYMSLPANVGGRLELRGGPTRVLASFNFPANAGGRNGEVRLKLFRRANVAVARYWGTFQNVVATVVTTGSSDNLNNAGVRAPNEDTILYRLYWVPADTGTVTFADMVSRIVV